MDQTVVNPQNKATLYEIADILSKPFSNRTNDEHNKLVEVLSNIGYFNRFIADPSERKDFILAMSKHLKYKHYPKGAAVCHPTDPEIDFGIILQGHAIVYDPKTEENFEKDSENIEKGYKFLPFKKMAEEKEFSKKYRKLQVLQDHLNNSEASATTKNPIARINRFSIGYISAVEALETTVNELLGTAKSQEDSQDQGNLTIEEKLLLLHHDGSIQNYFTDGIASYEKIRDIKDGDTITELSLLTGMSVCHPIIVYKDLHVLSIAHIEFYSLFQARVGNLAEKKRFLWNMFPELLLGMIMKLAVALSERLLLNRDVVYEQGEEADAIYILKTGGVQLITYEEGEKMDKIPCSSYLTDGPKKNNTGKQKLIIGEIGVGGIFGEDEVIDNKLRKYTAICSKSPTLLYVLKKQVYRDILEKHFPLIAQAYKLGMKSKVDWRQDRIKKGRKVMSDIADGPPKKVTTKIVIKTPRLLDQAEATSRNLGLKRPELVYDTQTATVMGFEERNSRNTRSYVKITTCGLDQQSTPPIKKLFEQAKAEKSQEKPAKKNLMKRSVSIFDKKPQSPKSKNIKRSTEKSKSKQFEVIDDPSTDTPFMYRLQTPGKFPSDIPPSPVMSPKNRGQPQTPLAQPRVLTLRKGSLMLNQLFSSNGDNSQKNLEINIPTSARILYSGSPLIHSGMRDGNSPVSSGMSPKNMYDGKTFSDALKNECMTPKSSRFYQRIVLARPTFKKKNSIDSIVINESTPLDIKAISRQHLQDHHEPAVPRLSIMTHRPSMGSINMGAGNNPHNSARNSPSSPKMMNINSRNYFDLENTVGTPKKVFLLNRGESEPRIVLVDHDPIRTLRPKKKSKMMM